MAIHRQDAIGNLVGFLRVGGGNQRRAVAARTDRLYDVLPRADIDP